MSECARRSLFRQADLTQERLETWNAAERVAHRIEPGTESRLTLSMDRGISMGAIKLLQE